MKYFINNAFYSSLFICLSSLLLFCTAFKHEFYISVCEIEHNPQTATLEIALKLFTDDLEKALEQQGTERLHIGTKKESVHTNWYIHQYLQKKFTITNNQDTLFFNYLGKEIVEDATWCYIEAVAIKKVDTLTLTNRLLIDLFDTQTNLVHIKAHQQKKNTILRKNQVTASFIFN